MDQPVETPSFAQKVRAWWADKENRKVLAVIAVLALSVPMLFSFPPRKPEAIKSPELDALARRVDALEHNAAPQPVEQPAPMPDPQPPRASAPRAALRPAQPANPPAAAGPQRWGTTDLDRAIAATPSVNLLEQAK